MKVSAIICTYNRLEQLKFCLESIYLSTFDVDEFEIIVIDNNSIDLTKELCNQYLDKGLKYYLEMNQGLSHARNRGWKEATGEYVAYIDDDAKVDSNWFATLLEIIKTDNPDVIGGPIYPFYTSEKPKWWKEEYEIRIHQNHSGELEDGNYISGSNMIYKKTIFEELGGFNTNLGMKGNTLVYREEGELLDRINQKNKFRLFYSLELIVFHWVNPYKFSLNYLIKFIIGQRKTLKISKLNNRTGNIINVYILPIVRLVKLVLKYIIRDRKRYPFFKNYFKEVLTSFFIKL